MKTAPQSLFQNTTYKMTQKEQIAFFAEVYCYSTQYISTLKDKEKSMRRYVMLVAEPTSDTVRAFSTLGGRHGVRRSARQAWAPARRW